MTESAISVAATGLAGRYALALFELAKQENDLDATAASFGAIRAAMAQSEDFRLLVDSRQFARDAMRKAVEAVASELALPPLTAKFLGTLAENGRLHELPAIMRQFDTMLSTYRGVRRAEVISAQPLSDAQTAELTAKLKARTGSEIEADLKVDPELLGGLIVRIGSEQIDSSVRTRLHRLGQQMKG